MGGAAEFAPPAALPSGGAPAAGDRLRVARTSRPARPAPAPTEAAARRARGAARRRARPPTMFARFRGNSLRKRSKQPPHEQSASRRTPEPFALSTKVKDAVSPEQLELLRKSFELFDADGSGFINSAELLQLLRAIGQNPTEDRLEELVRIADADQSGELSFTEFVDLWYSTLQESEMEMQLIEKAFSFLDKDGNGELSLVEFREAMVELGNQPLTDKECEEFFRLVDGNGDGTLQFKEFMSFLQKQSTIISPKSFAEHINAEPPQSVSRPEPARIVQPVAMVVKDVDATSMEEPPLGTVDES